MQEGTSRGKKGALEPERVLLLAELHWETGLSLAGMGPLGLGALVQGHYANLST